MPITQDRTRKLQIMKEGIKGFPHCSIIGKSGWELVMQRKDAALTNRQLPEMCGRDLNKFVTALLSALSLILAYIDMIEMYAGGIVTTNKINFQ